MTASMTTTAIADDQRSGRASRLRPTAPVAIELVRATMAVIDAHGEAAVRVQDIVAEVGVAIPVLYRHFGNREGLVQAAQYQQLHGDLHRELERAGAAIAAATSAAEFRELVDQLLERVGSPERHPERARRVNLLGSSYGRPELTAAIAEAQDEAIRGIAGLFREPQARGWVRAELDLDAFSAWLAGQLVARFMVDLRGPDADHSAYDALAARAVRHLLFD